MIEVNQISNLPIIEYCLFNIYIEMMLQIKVRILEPDGLELDPTSLHTNCMTLGKVIISLCLFPHKLN